MMRLTRSGIGIAFISIMVVSCSMGAKKKIIAKWRMDKVYNDNVDVSTEHNPNNDRWIEFDEDGNYKTDGTPYGPNTGKWSFTDEGLLYLDSDADEGDDSYWKVGFDDEGMTWKGAKFEFTKTFKITYKK